MDAQGRFGCAVPIRFVTENLWKVSNEGSGDLSMHEAFMQIALSQAEQAYSADEVPVGAVIVREASSSPPHTINVNVTRPHSPRGNARNHSGCGSVSQLATNGLRVVRDTRTVSMCAGAIIQARIPLVIYGTSDPKAVRYVRCSSYSTILAESHLPGRKRCFGAALW